MTLTPAPDAAARRPGPAPSASPAPSVLPSPSVSPSPSVPPSLVLRVCCEFGLTAVLLLGVVTGVRWLFAPDGYGGGGAAFAVLGAGVGALLAALMLSAPGRRSGAHLNPAVTLALWRLGAFPGRDVLPYCLAQLGGSVAGTWLGAVVWGPVVARPPVGYAAVRPGPGWGEGAVVAAEAGVLAASALMLAGLLARPVGRRLLPYAVGLVTALVIALLGPLTGGSANPARQFGPALLAWEAGGTGPLLWAYVAGPVLGAVAGAVLWRRPGGRQGARLGDQPVSPRET
ncbi:MIP/aquaporin family protein [Streptomyces bacillaris]|uniref:MIP/aquaporin family protein n=1 Tax=Streptomyces bacillaris TaxID=68179 RepID=UPI0034614EA3